MKEDFRPVLQITIIKCNLALWSKTVSQRLQERLSKNLILDTFLVKLSSSIPNLSKFIY
jgi:hypothetical protein